MCKAKVHSHKFWQHTVMAWFVFFFNGGWGGTKKLDFSWRMVKGGWKHWLKKITGVFSGGKLGSLITAGQSNGGGRGGALVQFGVGMWKIGIRGSGTNLMGVGIKFCQSNYKLIPSQLSCKKLSVNYLFICWIHLFIHWYINVWMCFVNSITCE